MSSKTIDEANRILKIQGDHGNWDYDPYMHGLYNGMEMILAIFEDRDPVFRAAPDTWLSDLELDKPSKDTESGESAKDNLQDIKEGK